MISQLEITPEQSLALTQCAHRISGLNVDPKKTDFLRLRLSGRLRILGMQSFGEYLAYLELDNTGEEPQFIVEALTTHTTSFFREMHQYEWLEKEGLAILSRQRASSAQPFIVWSAACSTGVELWSAGILLTETAMKGANLSSFELIGTDISRKIIRRAASATYKLEEISGLEEERRARFLLKSKRNLDENSRPVFRIVPELRSRARFENCNLTDTRSLSQFTADLVFLRNVLIYFNPTDQEKIVSAVMSRLRQGGVLLTGHSESLKNRKDLEKLGPSIYQKV